MSADLSVVVVAEQLRRAVPGGVGTYTVGLLRGLVAMGSAAPRVTVHASRTREQPDPLLALGHPVVTASLPARVLTRAWDRDWLGPPAAGSILHSTSLAFPPPHGRPLSVMVHDVAWREVPDAFPPRGRRWHEAAYLRALRHCRVIVVPADDVAAVVMADAPPGTDVRVIPEGCDHLDPPDHDGADRLLRAKGVTGPFLLSVGTIEPRKNLGSLVAGYELARPKLPEPWPLVLVGPRGWGEGAPVGGLGVVVTGKVPGGVLSALLERAQLLAYVPRAEGFGLPPVEAMAAGCPVVASPMPSIGGAAYEVDPGDVDSIAAGVVAVATDDALRAQLIERGRERAASLTWEAAARRHTELWEAMR